MRRSQPTARPSKTSGCGTASPLSSTYAQLQEIRTYYKFLDIDIDRYHLGSDYQQVTLVGARARARAAAAQRADLGEPASAVHPRQRRGDVAGHAQNRRGAADLLPAGHTAACQRRSAGSRAAHLFRPGQRALCHRQGQHARVRLSQGQGQRLCRLRRRRRRADRRLGAARLVLLVLRRSQHPALGLRHARKPHPAPSQHPGPGAHHRAVPAAGPRSLCRGQQRAALLAAGRLHHFRLVPLRAATILWRPQLHP